MASGTTASADFARSDSRGLPAVLGGTPVRPEGPPDWPADDPAVRAVLERVARERAWGKYDGPYCQSLIERLAAYHDCRHVVLCSSGTAAVELALRGLQVGPGDEVILAAYDFKGNFQNVLAVGATPVLIDVRPEDWILDPSRLDDAIGPATKAIIATHLHGGVVPMQAVRQIAQSRGVAVIEDACQMPGAVIQGRKAGTWGEAGVLSFGGSKLLSAGRGGALLTDRPEIVQRVRLYTRRGNEAYPLSELQAAVLIPQIEQLDARNARRAVNAARLIDLLDSSTGLRPVSNPDVEAAPGYYKLGLQYDADSFAGLSRDQFSAALRAEGIAVDPGFRALHRIHSRRRYRAAGPLNHADRADQHLLCLHHPVLLGDDDQIEQIAAAVSKVRRHAAAIRRKLADRSN